jgi:hypothetical protein
MNPPTFLVYYPFNRFNKGHLIGAGKRGKRPPAPLQSERDGATCRVNFTGTRSGKPRLPAPAIGPTLPVGMWHTTG